MGECHETFLFLILGMTRLNVSDTPRGKAEYNLYHHQVDMSALGSRNRSV